MRSSEASRLATGYSGSAERRRPGRQDVSPALLPLLRGQQGPIAEAARVAAEEDSHDLAPARGIFLGLLISLPLWIAVVVAIRALL